jgi:hypothetical protein
MPPLSLDPFVVRFDTTNPGVMECHCSVCHRLIAASRDMKVLEIVQRIHLDKWHGRETLITNKLM